MTYRQQTGELRRDRLTEGPAILLGIGYSGHGDGKNNPEMESVHEIGPIPRGLYAIGRPGDTLTHGPFVLCLTPFPGTRTFGRSGFLIHGESKQAPGTGSQGCIILGRNVREAVVRSSDRCLEVMA